MASGSSFVIAVMGLVLHDMTVESALIGGGGGGGGGGGLYLESYTREE